MQVKSGVYFRVNKNIKLIANKGCIIFCWGVKLTPSKQIKETKMDGKEFKCKIEDKYNSAIKRKAAGLGMSRQKYLEKLIEKDAKEHIMNEFVNFK